MIYLLLLVPLAIVVLWGCIFFRRQHKYYGLTVEVELIAAIAEDIARDIDREIMAELKNMSTNANV